MTEYIINSGSCLAIFYGFYKLFLEKDKNHLLKRFYLLGMILISFGIPLITFTSYIEVAPVETNTFSEEMLTFDSTGNDVTIPTFETDYTPIILWSVYGFITFLLLLKFVFNLSLLLLKIKTNPKFYNLQCTNVLLHEQVAPHTFFNYIFLNKHKFETRQIPQEVFWHEHAHASQKHSMDILFIELLKVVFWFNPLIYFISQSVKLNHEFLADQAVLNKGVVPSVYQNILLTFSKSQTHPSLANAINYSSIKKRFTVMKTPTSKNKLWLKSVFILPLIAILLVAFSQKETIIKQSEIIKTSTETISESTKTPIKNFLILIETSGDEIKLQSSNGSAWNKLGFTLSDGREQAINEFGMLNTLDADSKNDPKLANYKFTIRKSNNAIYLKSFEGTAWRELSFGFANNQVKQYINHMGMTSMMTQEMIEEYKNITEKLNSQPKNYPIKAKVVERMWVLYDAMSVEQKKNFGPSTVSNEVEIKKLLKKYNEAFKTFLNSNREDNSKLMELYYKLKSYEPQLTREQMIIFKLGPVMPPAANSKSQNTKKTSIQPTNQQNQEVIKVNDSTIYIKDVVIATSDKSPPDFHIVTDKAVNVSDRKIIGEKSKSNTTEPNSEGLLKKSVIEISNEQAQNSLKIIINKNGEYLVDGEYAEITDFTEKIESFNADQRKKLIINITAAEDAPAKDIDAVKNVLRKNNVLKVNFKIHHYDSESPKTTDAQIKSKYAVNTDGNIPFAQLDSSPVYLGCEGDNETIKACFHKNMQLHINRKFNPDLVQNLGLSSGKKKIYAYLKISTNGKIEAVSIRSPHEDLNKEMKRVVNLYPKVRPGMHDGKIVNTSYMIPITFNVE